MNVLLVIDSFGDGGRAATRGLAKGLAGARHRVEFFVYYPEQTHFRNHLRATGIVIHEVKKRSRFTLRVPISLLRLVRQRQFDVVLSFLPTPNVYCELASVFSSGHCLCRVRKACV